MIFAGLFCLVGCRKPEAPPFDRLRGQMIRETFVALAAGDTERSQRLLPRLNDLAPDQAFCRLALAHEREREQLLKLNDWLCHGEFDKADRLLRERAAQTRSSPALAVAAELLPALRALAAYTEQLPYRTSERADEELAKVEQHTVLRASPAYREWLAGQRLACARMRDQEVAAAVRQIGAAYDLALVADAPERDLVLAQWQATAPGHPGLAPVEVGLADDWTRLGTIADSDGLSRETRFGLELAACRHWPSLPASLRAKLRSRLDGYTSCSLSGVLLRSLLAADAGALAEALDGIQDLVGTAEIGPSSLAKALERSLLPRDQFAAGCWRVPFPSVPDLLTRLAQVRESPVRKENR